METCLQKEGPCETAKNPTAARKAEVVVLAIGEDCWQSGEGRSVANIGLSGLQMELFNEIYRINKNVVVVLMNGRPLAIEELAAKTPATEETAA